MLKTLAEIYPIPVSHSALVEPVVCREADRGCFVQGAAWAVQFMQIHVYICVQITLYVYMLIDLFFNCKFLT